MKKICSVILAIILIVLPMTISVYADGDLNENEVKLLEEFKKQLSFNGKSFAIPEEYISRAENYFKTIDITDSQAEEILDRVKTGEEIIEHEEIESTGGILNAPIEVQKEIIELGKTAVEVTNGNLSFDGKDISIKNETGKVVLDAAPIVKQTGLHVDFTATIIASITIIAILGTSALIAKKKGLFIK